MIESTLVPLDGVIGGSKAGMTSREQASDGSQGSRVSNEETN
jgi:hypothetical protein